ncbi:PAS domain S-box protein [Chloroflexota bacterium]
MSEQDKTKKELLTEMELMQKRIAELEAANDEYRNDINYTDVLIETAQIIILTLDVEGRIVHFNPYMEEISGYRLEEVKGKDWFSTFLPERGRERVRGLFKKAIGNIQTRGNINPILTKDGREREIEWYDKTLQDSNCTAIGLIAIGQDITKRKKAEEKLQESEERLRALIESTNDFIWEVDTNGVYTYCSPLIKELWGYTAEESIGKTPFERMIPEDRERTVEMFRAMAESRGSFSNMETSSFDNDGRIVVVETSGIPFYGADGSLCGYRGITRDITGRKQMENKLREEQRRLKEAQALGRIGSWEYDVDSKEITWDDETYVLYERDPALGPPNTEEEARYYPAKQVEMLRDYSARSIKNREEFRYDVEVLLPSGNISFFTCTMRPFTNESGRVVTLFGTVQDITERKQAEKALIESEENWRSLTENSPDHIMLLDKDANIQFINRTVPDLVEKDVIGKSVYEFTPSESHQDAANCFKRVLVNKESDIYNTEYRTADGETRYFEVRIGPVLHNGKVVAFISNSNDVTERKQAEEALRESHVYLQRLTGSMGDAVFSVNMPDREIEWVNDAFKILGYTPEECIGKTTEFIYSDRDEFLDFGKKMQKAVSEGKNIMYAEQLMKRKNGEVFPAEITVTFRKEGEIIVSATGIIRDISERKRYEEETMRVEKLESIGTLAGGIAHDFNNLLTGIMGNISLARGHMKLDKEAYERLEEAEKASVMARDLTQQLLTFATGGAPVTKVLDIRKLVESTCVFALRGSNVTCEVSMPKGLWAVEADAGQISQVITNLVINADQAMPEGGILKVGAGNIVVEEKSTIPVPEGSYVEISVEDNGIGISEAHMARIFEPYFTTKQKGSGLGLATSHSIIWRHHGHITAESKLNEGTTIRLYLPASDKPVLMEKEESEEISTRNKGIILVMDDEVIIRETLGKMLPLSGYEVEFSVDGAEAIERYVHARDSGKPFDAVIMDLTIPGGMGGVEAIGRLLEIDPDARVIVSSGYSTDMTMADYEKYGFSGIIAKPYSVNELRNVLKEVLPIIPDTGDLKGEDKTPKAAESHKYRILMMDDSEVILRAVSENLQEAGYEIECAGTGNDAIPLFTKSIKRKQPFDAVILDLNVRKGFGGEETIKRLRKITPDIIAIVTSGYLTDAAMLEPEKHGFDAALEKPFGIEELEELLSRLLKSG